MARVREDSERGMVLEALQFEKEHVTGAAWFSYCLFASDVSRFKCKQRLTQAPMASKHRLSGERQVSQPPYIWTA